MTFKEYVQWTVKTWATDDFDFMDQLNCVLGVSGELGEMSEALPEDRMSEAADALYYCCRLVQGLGIEFSTADIFSSCGPTPLRSSGKLSEYYKKALRGDYDVDPEKVKPILAAIINRVSNDASLTGYESQPEALCRIIIENVRKLEGRLSRGTICGSTELIEDPFRTEFGRRPNSAGENR